MSNVIGTNDIQFDLDIEPTPVPSISSSAFKVFISISQWAGMKKDKKASAEVTDSNHAKAGTARVTKSLLGDNAELKAIQKLAGQVRNDQLYIYSLPWDDSGWRLLTTALMPEFFKMMTEMQNEFYRLVDVFIANYAFAKTEAIIELGDLFDPTDYPSEDVLRAKFSFKIDKEPIAETGDWRVDVQNDAMDSLKSDYSKRYAEKLSGAMNDVWAQLHDKLSKLSERIDYGDHEDKKVFKSGTVDNLTGLVDLLDSFNITNDPLMTKTSADLKRCMRGVSPEALREDSGLRAETKRNLDQAIKNLPSLL